MRKVVNNVHIEGYVYQHNLENKVSGQNAKNPGTEFISGTLSIATDEEMLNVIQVHYTYVTAVTAKGKPNNTYNILQSIIDGKIGSAMEHGKENAGMVRIDTAIALNEWYDDKTAGNPLVSVKRNEGGFIHQVQSAEQLNSDVNQRATFETDMVITGTTRLEANEERELPERVNVKGCIFDFRGAILPVEFTVSAGYSIPAALDYFENLGASSKSPVFTKVKGIEVSKTVVRTVTEEGAFGDSVKEVRNTQRDFVITWAQAAPYEWDSEDSITAVELDEKSKEREVYLANIKQRQDEYKASQGGAFAAAPATTGTAAAKEYNF